MSSRNATKLSRNFIYFKAKKKAAGVSACGQNINLNTRRDQPLISGITTYLPSSHQ